MKEWSPLGGYRFLKPLFFRLPPERAHQLSLAALAMAGSTRFGRSLLQKCYAPPETQPIHMMGLSFPHAIGLAAGYDKGGRALDGLAALGFGHIEVGTVTPLPQPGNEGERVRRLPSRHALVNRMGFPSEGAEVVERRLVAYREREARDQSLRSRPVIGVNLGKNKETANEQAANDYRLLAQRFAPLADYLAVNISSPNTPGLRALQQSDALKAILDPLLNGREVWRSPHGKRLPIVVKLAPELATDHFEETIRLLSSSGVDGVVLANTRQVSQPWTGGLSGAPLAENTLKLVQHAQEIAPQLCVIASGGIGEPSHVEALKQSGAQLVQVWTALIYRGPKLLRVLTH